MDRDHVRLLAVIHGPAHRLNDVAQGNVSDSMDHDWPPQQDRSVRHNDRMAPDRSFHGRRVTKIIVLAEPRSILPSRVNARRQSQHQKQGFHNNASLGAIT